VYKTVNDSILLKLRFIKPVNPSKEKKPCAIFLSGGGWDDFSWSQLDELAYGLSDQGILSVIVEYRTKKKHNSSPFDALEDVKDALKYLRENKATLNILDDKIIAIGISAGAHLAFSSFLVDNVNNIKFNENAKPNYIIGFSPVIRNDSSGYGYKRIKENYKWFSPFYNYINTDSHLPPSLIISGDNDSLIDIEDLKIFSEKAKQKGDEIKLHEVINVGHSMKRTYKSIYTQSFPLISAFFHQNKLHMKPILATNNSYKKAHLDPTNTLEKNRSNTPQFLFYLFISIVIGFIVGYSIKKSKHK